MTERFPIEIQRELVRGQTVGGILHWGCEKLSWKK